MLPLRDIAAEMCLGKMLDKAKNRGTPQPYLRNVNVRWFSFNLDDMKEMAVFEDGEEVRFGLEPGDLVICEGGAAGSRCGVEWTNEGRKDSESPYRVDFVPASTIQALRCITSITAPQLSGFRTTTPEVRLST